MGPLMAGLFGTYPYYVAGLGRFASMASRMSSRMPVATACTCSAIASATPATAEAAGSSTTCSSAPTARSHVTACRCLATAAYLADQRRSYRSSTARMARRTGLALALPPGEPVEQALAENRPARLLALGRVIDIQKIGDGHVIECRTAAEQPAIWRITT
jgi:hypothetical protein